MSTSERQIEIPMAAGTADAVILRPEGGGQWPGVLHLTDVGGIRPAHLNMARRLAAEGYVVLVPNLFYRTSRPPVIDIAPEANHDTFLKRFLALTSPLTPEALETDAVDYVKALIGDNFVRPDARFGVVGYCFSGGVAMQVAATVPDRVGAAASFHGGRLVTDTPASPHLLLPRIRASLYFGHAVEDRSMPQEAIEKLNAALGAWGGGFQSELYDGAYHSWTASDSPVYHPAQADRAFQKLREFFARTLQAAD